MKGILTSSPWRQQSSPVERLSILFQCRFHTVPLVCCSFHREVRTCCLGVRVEVHPTWFPCSSVVQSGCLSCPGCWSWIRQRLLLWIVSWTETVDACPGRSWPRQTLLEMWLLQVATVLPTCLTLTLQVPECQRKFIIILQSGSLITIRIFNHNQDP